MCVIINTEDDYLPMGCERNCGGDLPPSGLVTKSDGDVLVDNVAELRVSLPVCTFVFTFIFDGV